MGISIFDERRPFNSYVLSTSGSLGTTSTLASDNSERFRVDTIIATNNDTIAHPVQLDLFLGDQPVIGTVTVPAGAGYGTVATFDVLAALGTAFANGLALNPGQRLEMTVVSVDVGAGLFLAVLCFGGYLV